jgi:hypothetical protein
MSIFVLLCHDSLTMQLTYYNSRPRSIERLGFDSSLQSLDANRYTRALDDTMLLRLALSLALELFGLTLGLAL